MKRIRLQLTTLLLFIANVLSAQQVAYRVEGYVLDSSTKRGVAGAVVIAGDGSAVATQRSGYFTLALNKGRYTLESSHLSYSPSIESIDVQGDCKIEILLSSEGVDIEDVVVSANSPLERVSAVQIGV